MKIHVGSFWSKAPNDCEKISIARTKPANVDCYIYPVLFPSFNLLMDYKHNRITWEDYKARYCAELHGTLFIKGIKVGSLSEKLVQLLTQNEKGHEVEFMLCCWERRSSVEEREIKPCHRDIIYSLLTDDVKGESID